MMFTEPLAAAIIRGEKTATRRRFSDKPRSPWHPYSASYPVGKVFTINPGRGVARIAECEVTGRSIGTLANVRAAQAQREGFRSLLAFRDAWAKINGTFDLAERVHVIEFRLAGPECPTCEGTKLVGPAFIEDDCTDCFATGVEVTPAGRKLLEKLGVEG